MQQRIVHHLTRYPQRTDDLEASIAHVEAEAQAQADWVETAAHSIHAPEQVTIEWVEEKEREMQLFLGGPQNPDSLRSQLKETSQRAKATREIQQEIARRYPRPAP